MRHMARIKKKPKLNTFMLHSKSTYFYKQRWNSYLIPAMCTSALLLGTSFAINPIIGNKPEAHAAINEDLGNGSTISMAIMNNGSEVANEGTVSTDAEARQVSYIDNTIKVTTNKIGKYYIGVQAASDGSSKLTGANHSAQINEVGTNVKPENFGDNTWGYVLTDNTTVANEDLAYSTLPSYNTGATPQYASTQNPANGEHELKLTFAAKILADKPADHYQTTALVSVAAEAREVAYTWDEMVYMQDMTNSICTNAAENASKQLIDKRDNKTYWVAKLKNGSCWMTQNLDFDIPQNELKADLTDIAQDWNITTNATYPPIKTQTGTPSGFSSSSNSAQGKNVILSYDPGEYAYTKPTTRLSSGCGLLNSDNCKNAGWILMNGASTDKTGNEMTHYLAGNYYTFNAATAGQGYSKSSGNIENSSICPKNWQLPIGSITDNTSFSKLFAAYGKLDGTNAGTQDIRLAPLHFIYSGYINSEYLEGAGSAGYSLSSTVKSESSIALLNFAINISTYSNNAHCYGYPIRCVAR